MRLFIFISILVFLQCCAGPKNTAMIPDNLKGTWVPLKQEIGGTTIPKAAFQDQKLILGDNTYTLMAESVDKGMVKYKGDKVDIYGKEGENAGKHFTAIYKYENEQLTICYNLKGDSYPKAFETKSDRLLFLSVFQKENKK